MYVTYSELAGRVDPPIHHRNVGKNVGQISILCHELGLTLLSAKVVTTARIILAFPHPKILLLTLIYRDRRRIVNSRRYTPEVGMTSLSQSFLLSRRATVTVQRRRNGHRGTGRAQFAAAPTPAPPRSPFSRHAVDAQKARSSAVIFRRQSGVDKYSTACPEPKNVRPRPHILRRECMIWAAGRSHRHDQSRPSRHSASISASLQR